MTLVRILNHVCKDLSEMELLELICQMEVTGICTYDEYNQILDSFCPF